jgi:hypothetical protein
MRGELLDIQPLGCHRLATVVNTLYDALGQASWTSMPATEPYTTTFSRPAGWDSRPNTQGQYDALGRTVRTVAPDGSDGTALYYGKAGAYTSQVDASGHYRFSIADGLGRLTRVDETLSSMEDTFNTLDTARWSYDCCQALDNGTLKLTTPGWANQNRTAGFTPGTAGMGVKLAFKVEPGTPWALYALAASGQAYQMGIAVEGTAIKVRYNADGVNFVKIPLITPTVANAWYVATLKATAGGYNYVEVWESGDPAHRAAYAVTLPANQTYAGLSLKSTGKNRNVRLDLGDEQLPGNGSRTGE